jgi:hypothetical protein
MTQADSVHSTPPTNTSPTRRNILGTIAGAGATALTLAPARAAASAADPIYAAIERHRAAATAWNVALETRPEFPEPLTTEQREQCRLFDDAEADARDALSEAGHCLIETVPTTIAGITTAIAYIQRQMRDDGTFMPFDIEFQFDEGYEGDGGQVLAWIDAFLGTMAVAVSELDRAGKAVQS